MTPIPFPAPPRPDVARALLDYLQDQREAMVALLAELVRLESPSLVPETQGPVLARLAEPLQAIGYRTRRLPGRKSGGHLFARYERAGRSAQLLLGHCDTVWPRGTLDEMPVHVANGTLHGPGAYDMKGGLVQGLFALRALHDLGLEPSVTPLVFVNSDEEIGSGESTRWIRRLARCAERVFVLEPSLGPMGHLKTARKGVGRFTITVKGRAAHAGLNPEEGSSAILELSYLVQKLFALNDPARGVTVNVGTIDGGLRPNVVAPQGRVVVDVRVPTHEEARRIEAAIHGLTPETPNVRLTITGHVARPPMERTPRNRQLWHLAQHAAEVLGMGLEEGMAGGGSDGNTTSRYTATLDGLGAVGDGAHASHEGVQIARMPERTALLACLLLAPPLPPPATP